MSKIKNVGGQAVIEGVMMRGNRGIATAVRLEDGSIEVKVEESTPLTKKYKVFGLPIIRGFISLAESLVVGVKSLNYAASFFGETEEEPSKFDKAINNIFKDKTNDVIMGLSLVIALAFSTLLFFIIPTLIAHLSYKVGFGRVGVNIIEGLIRVGIFLAYIYLIGKMKDIRRVFEYHGAEHKTIFCYENDEELVPEKVKEYGRLHPRCGTNFLFIVMIVSILLFSLMEFNSIWQKVLYRLVLLPIVSGVSYELIRWMGKSEGVLSSILSYPGLKLQILTTREPDISQLQVAIISLKAAEGIDYDKDLELYGNKKKTEEEIKEVLISQLLTEGNELLKNAGIESYVLDSQLIMGKVLNKDKLWIITNRGEKITFEKSKEFFKLIHLREKKMPIKYIIEQCDFMNISLYVKEGVLIPRPDTETLVQYSIDIIRKNNYNTICDLCCGSGAIGLAIAGEISEIKVECVDISDIAEEVTNINIKGLELSERVSFTKSDLLQNAIEKSKVFDAIISNPPYIKEEDISSLMEDVKNYEPHLALSGGEDGLDFYRRITEQAKQCLKKGGLLAFEIGHDQGAAVKEIIEQNGFEEVQIFKDLAEKDRVVLGIKVC